MEIKTTNDGLIPRVLYMLLVEMHFMIGTTSRVKHTGKKFLKNREVRLGIIGEVVGEMVKADYHTHKGGIPTQTHANDPVRWNCHLALRMRPLPSSLDLSSPQSTKDSLIPNNTDIIPFCFCFWHVFSNHIHSVCTPTMKRHSF